jgi:AcrR family transcriptional regulator
LRRGYHVGNLRTRILNCAGEMLEEAGPAGPNLRALAERIGITAGSLYHHFDSKAALMAALAAQGFAALRSRLETAEGRAQEGARLRAWTMAYFAFARERPVLYALMMEARTVALPEVAAARAQVLAGLERVVQQVADEQQRVDPPLEKISLAVWAATHGAASLSASDEAHPALMEDVIAGLDALFRGR